MKPCLITPCAIACVATSAMAQSVTVSVQGPVHAAPGDVVQLSVYASAPDLPSAGAFAGYGLNLNATAGASAVAGLSPASSPIMDVGAVPGTPDAGALTRVVGGQLSNIFGLTPGSISPRRSCSSPPISRSMRARRWAP